MVRFPGVLERDSIKGNGGIEFISTSGTKVEVLVKKPEPFKRDNVSDKSRKTGRLPLSGL